RSAAARAATGRRPPGGSAAARSAAGGRSSSARGRGGGRSSALPYRAGVGGGALVGMLEQPGQQRLLGVEAVLRLIPHHGGGAVDHLSGDLLAAVGRQAVQEDPAGELHQLGGDLERREGLLAAPVLALLSH